MNRVFRFAAVLLCLICAGSVFAEPHAEKIRVGIFQVDPLNFMDESGEARGLNPDLLRGVAKEKPRWEFVFVPVTWAGGLEKLQTGDIDLMVSVSYTAERAEVMDYSKETVLEVWGQVFVRPDSGILSTLDLQGRSVGIMRRDINGANFKKLVDALGVECEIAEFDSHAEIFAAVRDKTISAGVTPNHYGLRHEYEYRLIGTSIQFSPSPIYYAAKRGRLPELLTDIDAVISEWKQDENSYYYQRLNYWFGINQTWVQRVPVWVKIVIPVSVGSVFLLAGISWLLKHQVKLKTAELTESRERYRILVENQSDLIVKVDTEGRFLYVSPSYCEMFGKSEKSLLGNTFMPLVHEEDRASTETEFKKVFAPPYEAYMEQRALTKHGWRWLSWKDTAILDEYGNVIQIIGSGRDVTEQKQAERAYNESSERLKLATGASQIGIWDYDLAEDKLVWDEQMFKLYDVEPTAFKHVFQSWVDCAHPEDLPKVIKQFGEAVENDIPFDTEFRVVWRDGSIRHLRAQAMVQRNAEGKAMRVIGSNWDITRYRRMVAALQESERDYRELFDNMTAGFVLFEVLVEEEGNPADFLIIQVNPAAENISELSRRDLVGKKITDILKPHETEWMDLLMRVASTGQSASYEQRVDAVGKVFAAWVFVPKPGHLAVVFTDNSARRAAENAVLRAQRQLQHIIDNTKDVIFQIDLESNFIYVNAASEDLLGYTVDELLTMNMNQLVLPEFHEEMQMRLDRRLAGEPISGNFSFEIVRKDGKRLWLELATNGVFDEFGKLEAIQGVARDITERRDFEIQLEASRSFLQAVIDTIPVRVFWKDLESAYLGANIAFAGDAGFGTAAELIGKTDFDMGWGKNEADLYRSDDAEIMSTGTERLNYEEPQTGPGGTVNWLRTSKVPLRDADGTIIGVLGTYEDITARKELEQERMRLTAAINQSAEAIVVMDPIGMVQYVNPAFERVTGYTREEALGKNLAIIKSGRHDDQFYKGIWETIEAGRSWRGRIINRHKDASFYTVEAAFSPVRDNNDKIINYVVTIRDVTQEIEMESHMRQVQKMEAVGRLAGGVAHDFNNILQSILGFSGILLTELEPESSQYSDVIEIRKAARRAGDLTRQLLTFSRKHNVEYAAQSMNEIIRQNEKMMSRLIGERIEFSFDLEEPIQPVHADVSQIEQVLMNLFINARDAMPDGGRLFVSTRNIKVEELPEELRSTANIRSEYSHVLTTVRDTGCGIREDVQEHLFEPFFTTKKVGQGTGLGLSVVYGIVQQHGGLIEVESKVGEGATFRFYLPVYDRCELSISPVDINYESAESPEGKGEVILVLEDDPVVCELSERMLRDAGYEVVSATSLADARMALKRHEIDLLLADVILPDGNGLELAMEIRGQSETIPVLLCSGYALDADVHSEISKKGFRFVEKPVTAMQLLQVVREMLDETKRV